MTHNILHLSGDNNDQWLLVHQDELILEALLEHGVAIKQACTNGVCGVCLTPLLKGEIDYADRIPRGLNEKEKQNGYFLPCIAKCKTAIRIGPPKVKLR
ncbi:2Fe-2S iron-sulfur cluster-binding protein [Marinomonas transparens]|uniref:2Fe-2S iron-sulfur cluster binding domain-containing protein n=1 Tax=Marinomonas transparens TaxID=2795388 RepID=A0A934JWQ4_9GAMM|nr:2Fe-2S iron-sulfur cluster-binding protein [Marinomonas transparens]MBJ7539781.1 2Fe-2S iron-sulfur cluster binding domain-containing protein [Marinomonas transparens]